jgi:hypothetical protein
MSTTGHLKAIDLPGLHGANPLGFLAALGTLRLLDEPDRPPRLSWQRAQGGWTARLWCDPRPSEEELVEHLAHALGASADLAAFARWDDLSVAPEDFRRFVEDAARTASLHDRDWADFAAAFGCEASPYLAASRPTIQDTAFRTMSGAGHQHFLKTMRHVLSEVTADHVQKAVFGTWTYDDPVEKCTLRWDPSDDVRYALRWRNPSGDPDRGKRGSMLGANALAVHGLPLHPTAPVAPQGSHLATTGFSRIGRQVTWTWPIWEPPLPLSVVRSLLALPELQSRAGIDPEVRSSLARRGVSEIFHSRRITTGKYRNFTPAEPA